MTGALVAVWLGAAVFMVRPIGRIVIDAVLPNGRAETGGDLAGVGAITIVLAAMWPVVGLAWGVGALIEREASR